MRLLSGSARGGRCPLEPIARLPDSIELNLDEAAVVLGALDRAAEAVEPETEDRRAIRAATRLITAKLWPALGDLLDDDERWPGIMTSGTGLTTIQVAGRLGITPEAVYRLVFAGDLAGQPDQDGVVRISEQELAAYLERDSSHA